MGKHRRVEFDNSYRDVARPSVFWFRPLLQMGLYSKLFLSLLFLLSKLIMLKKTKEEEVTAGSQKSSEK